MLDAWVGADHALVGLLLQRGLAAVYLIAFLVTANQFRPLVGERGLLPAPSFLERTSLREAPSLFHLGYSDRAAAGLAWLGVALSALALAGVPGTLGTPATMATWALLWVLYLSFVNVGQVFYAYGWESLLLEAGFLAIFLGAAGGGTPEVVIWLYRWLLFRVMLGAGLIKLRGDPCWRDLTCLAWHYETQPLPNRASWWLHRSPMWMHRAGVAFTHFAQLVVPFGYFGPPPVRWAAGALTILFQGTLIASGNLSWLNWLTVVLALSCFDDALLAALPGLDPVAAAPAGWHWWLATGVAALVALLSVRVIRNLFSSGQRMNASFDPLRLVNTYGAFGGVTRRRNEVVLEGTDAQDPSEGADWREYGFRAKPGDPRRPPPVVAPYHLRLDWQMWFAAMSSFRRHPWITVLAKRILEGDRAVLGLLRRDPFPDAPPRWLRARLYRYRFSTLEERRRSGRWWTRDRIGTYLPALRLVDGTLQPAPDAAPDLVRRAGG